MSEDKVIFGDAAPIRVEVQLSEAEGTATPVTSIRTETWLCTNNRGHHIKQRFRHRKFSLCRTPSLRLSCIVDVRSSTHIKTAPHKMSGADRSYGMLLRACT